MNFYLFLVTVPNFEEAKRMGHILVKSKLAACVNIIQNIFSIYEWKGKIEEENEYLLLIKTLEQKVDLLIQRVNEIHNYEIPECIGLKIKKGSEKYLNWIKQVLE